MEVCLLARCFRLLLSLSLFGIAATVSQPKAEQSTRLVADDAVKRSRTVLGGHAHLHSSDDDRDVVPVGLEEGAIHGHVNGRGVYVADAKVGVIQDGVLHRRESAAGEKDSAGEVEQPAFMRRALKLGGDGDEESEAAEEMAMDESWLDLQPVSLAEAEAEASTTSDMDESFNWWDRRRRRRRYDCRWTSWTGWKPCTVNCGAGEKQRDRQTDGPHWGGKICAGAKSEYSTCNLQNCAVNCEWNHWGAWGPCTRTCGGGMRVRQRGALPFTNRDGGAICLDSQKKKNGPCNAFKCPIPCSYGAWSLWGGCSKTCGSGGGLKRRTRDQIGPYHGGAGCTIARFLDEPCNAFTCPVDCLFNQWGGWGTCSRTCGGGIKLRERTYLIQAQNGGVHCAGSPAEILACNIEDCATDCVWAPWHDPGPCTKTCGGGAFKRHRAHVVNALMGGKDCTGPSTQVGPCNVEPCAMDCVYDEWEPWNQCSASCGGGIHTAMRNSTDPLHGGVSCSLSNKSKEEECNTDPCSTILVKNAAQHQSVMSLMIVAQLLMMRR